ncbi:MAG: AI-2E family transporter [Verrucomicrobiota bacterium]
MKKATSADSLATISNVLLTAFLIVALYVGREILVPLALAALLTFILAPLATRLERWLGRVGSVLVITGMLVVATVGAGWVLTSQAVDLANKLPDYKVNIRTKLRSLQMPQGGRMKEISKTLEELKKEIPSENGLVEGGGEGAERKPSVMPVKIVEQENGAVKTMQGIVMPVLGPLGTAGLVLLLLIFMLLQREDLRNRMIRLIGQGRIGQTTRAMDDAGSRVSKYLRMQLIVNVTYGIPIAIGLWFIGIPNAILWGALATVLRFIPYIGPWIAAAFPILLSLAVSPDWQTPLYTLGLFVVVELISNNVMEPWLYGSSTGVSPIALIVAALFWTLLWGPVGLVLATPLTVCLVVMGRHIPKLAFLSIVLSDEEALTPSEECYYRLQRSGEHAGVELADNFLKSHAPADLYDSVLIPVITTAETDRRSGQLDNDQLGVIHRGLRDVIEELEIRLDPVAPSPPQAKPFHLACLPAKGERDEIAGEMLQQLLRQCGVSASVASSRMVAGEAVQWLENDTPDVVCISAVSPSTALHARYLCAKLRSAFPDLRILIGLWCPHPAPSDIVEVLRASGADEVFHSLTTMTKRVAELAPAGDAAGLALVDEG